MDDIQDKLIQAEKEFKEYWSERTEEDVLSALKEKYKDNPDALDQIEFHMRDKDYIRNVMKDPDKWKRSISELEAVLHCFY